MKLMEYFGIQVDPDWGRRKLRPSRECSDESISDHFSKLPFDARDQMALWHLLNRPWLGRLWIRQEIYLANPQAIMLCGVREIL